jgi:hypothetical protein
MSQKQKNRTSSAALAVLFLALFAGTGCYDKDDYDLTPGLVETQLSLQVKGGTNTLPADGFSRVGLVAKISPKADADRRTVVFTTSAGTMVGGTAVQTTWEVPADASGEAFIELQSSQKIETAVVTAQVKGVPGLSTTLTVAFVPVQPDDVIEFTGFPSHALPADGASLTPFTVTISDSIPSASRTVSFTTTVGTFAPGTDTTISVPADAGNTATVELRSPTQITSGRVRATVNGVTREVPVSFDRALPNFISLAADKFTVAASAADQVALTATLTRNIGMVTPNSPVVFKAVGTAGTTDVALPSTFFQNVTVVTLVNGQSVATAVFRPGATDYRGAVTVTVEVPGSSVRGSVELEIVAPQ